MKDLWYLYCEVFTGNETLPYRLSPWNILSAFSVKVRVYKELVPSLCKEDPWLILSIIIAAEDIPFCMLNILWVSVEYQKMCSVVFAFISLCYNCIICLMKFLHSYNLNHAFHSLLKAVRMTENILMKYSLFISCILATKGADFTNIDLVLLHLSEFGMWISHCSVSPLPCTLSPHLQNWQHYNILRPYYYCRSQTWVSRFSADI